MTLEATATIPAAPAAPATIEATPAIATPDAPATEGGAAKPSGKQRARDLAGKYLQGNAAKDLAGPGAETPPAAPATAKPGDKPAEAKPAETTATEPAKETEPPKPKPDDPLEKSWREVHRKKKLQRARDAELAEQRATLAKEKGELDRWRTEQTADEKLKREDPPAWLEKHRFDFREVALAEVRKQQLTPEQKEQKAEFDAIRAELAAEKTAREKAETDARSVLEEYKAERAAKAQREARTEVNAESASEWSHAKDEFPTLATYYTPEEIAETATQLRVDHYRKHKREPGFDDVFAFMETNAAAHQKRFNRPAIAAERTERDTVGTEVPKTRAKVGPPVTNQVAATRASPTTPLTADEKRARAVAKAGELMGPRH